MFNLGPAELALILVIVVFVFGSTKLPDLASGLGETIERLRERQRVEPAHLLLQRASRGRWSLSDWLLVGAAVLSVSVAAGALLTAHAR